MKILLILTLGLALLICGGCSTTNSTRASTLKSKAGTQLDLRSYQIATVVPFSGSTPTDPGVGSRFATDIASRLKFDFGTLFSDVRVKEKAAGEYGELVVTGHIRDYEPGSRFVRSMMIGAASARFKADLVLKDAASGQDLLIAPIDKLWAWGGLIGASKGIEDMLAESAAASARTIAEGKGWTASKGR